MSDTPNSDPRPMKVTDRRMFTPDGQLREEYRHLENKAESSTQEPPTPPPEPAAAEPVATEPPSPAPEEPDDGPVFTDLVTLLAEHASIYLRQAMHPGPEQRESRELARLHIELLRVLKDKTAGNLDARDEELLDDVIYRLKLGFANSQGF